jgi:hypothetical protein
MTKRKGFSVPLSDAERQSITEWQELMGFKSATETARFLLFIGQMSLEMASDRPITAEDFARVLYETGAKFFQAEFRPNLQDTVRKFRAWQQNKQETQLRSLSPTKRLR